MNKPQTIQLISHRTCASRPWGRASTCTENNTKNRRAAAASGHSAYRSHRCKLDWVVITPYSLLRCAFVVRSRKSASDLVEWIGTFQHPEGLFAVPAVAHAGLLQCGKAGHLLLERLGGEHLVVVIDVVGGQDRLAVDVHCPAWRFQHQRGVLADRLKSGEPRRLDDAGGNQVASAGEAVKDEALVERWLAVGARRIGDVTESASTGKQRRLPTVAQESGELADPLAADAQTGADEFALVVTDLHRSRRAEQLLVARPAHQVALDRRPPSRVCLGGQRALHPRRNRHLGLDVKAHVDQWFVLLAVDQVGRRGLHRFAVVAHRPGVERLDAAEPQPAGAEHGGTAIRPFGGPALAVFA